MPRHRSPRSWTAKPLLCVPYNPSSPLAAGLQGFYALNEGAGGVVNDATGNLNLAATGYGSTNPWTTTPYGSGISSPNQSQYVGAVLPARLQVSWPVTLVMAVQITSTGTTGWLLGATYTSTASNPFTAWLITQNTGTWKLGWNTAGTLATATTSVGYSAGNTYVVGVEFRSNGHIVYQNGSSQYTDSTAASAPSYTSGSILHLGDPFAQGAADVNFIWAAWWNRTLSPAEHAAIGASPTAIFGQLFTPARATSVFWASGGTTTFVYFGDIAFALDGSLWGDLNSDTPSGSDGSVALPFVGDGPALIESSLSGAYDVGSGTTATEGLFGSGLTGDTPSVADSVLGQGLTSDGGTEQDTGFLAPVTLDVYAADSGTGIDLALLVPFIADAGLGLDGSYGSTVLSGQDAGSAEDGSLGQGLGGDPIVGNSGALAAGLGADAPGGIDSLIAEGLAEDTGSGAEANVNVTPATDVYSMDAGAGIEIGTTTTGSASASGADSGSLSEGWHGRQYGVDPGMALEGSAGTVLSGDPATTGSATWTSVTLAAADAGSSVDASWAAIFGGESFTSLQSALTFSLFIGAPFGATDPDRAYPVLMASAWSGLADTDPDAAMLVALVTASASIADADPDAATLVRGTP